MTETRYGKYVVKKPSRYTLVHGVEAPKEEVTGRTPSNIFMDRDLVPESDKHVAVMRFQDVPHPNPFIKAHAHPYDEILMFMGHDPKDVEYLGAEIELYLGEEMEMHLLATSTTIYLPKGLKHLLKHRSVEKPHTLIAISMSGEYR